MTIVPCTFAESPSLPKHCLASASHGCLSDHAWPQPVSIPDRHHIQLTTSLFPLSAWLCICAQYSACVKQWRLALDVLWKVEFGQGCVCCFFWRSTNPLHFVFVFQVLKFMRFYGQPNPFAALWKLLSQIVSSLSLFILNQHFLFTLGIHTSCEISIESGGLVERCCAVVSFISHFFCSSHQCFFY